MATAVLNHEDRQRVERLAADFGLRLSATLHEHFPESWEEAMGIVLGATALHALTNCRCYGGCPSGAEGRGCGCEANNPAERAPDGRA